MWEFLLYVIAFGIVLAIAAAIADHVDPPSFDPWSDDGLQPRPRNNVTDLADWRKDDQRGEHGIRW